MLRASDPDVVASPCSSSSDFLNEKIDNDDDFLLSDLSDTDIKETDDEDFSVEKELLRRESGNDFSEQNFSEDEETLDKSLSDLCDEEEDKNEDEKTVTGSGGITDIDTLSDDFLGEIEEVEDTLCISLDAIEDDFDLYKTEDEEIADKQSDSNIKKDLDSDNLSEVLENLQIPSQEPWPKDVRLYQPYEIEQILLPDNANCLAVQAFLKMCDLEFQVEPRANAEAMSPSGKVPFIKAGAFVVSELEPIVQFVNNKGITLTEKLDPEMKSDMRAYMSLVHNVMEVAELYICWCDPETYNEVTSIRHGSIYPWPLNHIQNRAKKSAVIKKLKVLGWYQKSMAEVFQEVDNCCQALTDRLEGKDYFFGERPTELDALVFGHLFTILTTPLPNSHIANTVRNYPVLINLVQRIEKEYFKRETKH